MSSDPSSAPPVSLRPRRRRIRFGLRTIFVLTAVVAVFASLVGIEFRKYERQEQIAQLLENRGFMVTWEDAYFGLVRQVVSASVRPGTMSEAHLLETVALLTELPSLGELTLNEESFGDVHCELIAQCRNLKRLNLSHTQISDEGLKKLAALKKLQQLEIVNTQVWGEGVDVLMEANPELLILDD